MNSGTAADAAELLIDVIHTANSAQQSQCYEEFGNNLAL
jgi:hypothetical protein